MAFCKPDTELNQPFLFLCIAWIGVTSTSSFPVERISSMYHPMHLEFICTLPSSRLGINTVRTHFVRQPVRSLPYKHESCFGGISINAFAAKYFEVTDQFNNKHNTSLQSICKAVCSVHKTLILSPGLVMFLPWRIRRDNTIFRQQRIGTNRILENKIEGWNRGLVLSILVWSV